MESLTIFSIQTLLSSMKITLKSPIDYSKKKSILPKSRKSTESLLLRVIGKFMFWQPTFKTKLQHSGKRSLDTSSDKDKHLRVLFFFLFNMYFLLLRLLLCTKVYTNGCTLQSQLQAGLPLCRVQSKKSNSTLSNVLESVILMLLVSSWFDLGRTPYRSDDCN